MGRLSAHRTASPVLRSNTTSNERLLGEDSNTISSLAYTGSMNPATMQDLSQASLISSHPSATTTRFTYSDGRLENRSVDNISGSSPLTQLSTQHPTNLKSSQDLTKVYIDKVAPWVGFVQLISIKRLLISGSSIYTVQTPYFLLVCLSYCPATIHFVKPFWHWPHTKIKISS